MNNDLAIKAIRLINKLKADGRHQDANLVARITADFMEIKDEAKSLEDKILFEEYAYMAQSYD